MVSITINAPQRPMEVHRRLSERIIRAVAETYQCDEAEVVLAILVKPPEPAEQCRPGTVLCTNAPRPGGGTDCRAARVAATARKTCMPGLAVHRLAGRPAPRRYLRAREGYAAAR